MCLHTYTTQWHYRCVYILTPHSDIIGVFTCSNISLKFTSNYTCTHFSHTWVKTLIQLPSNILWYTLNVLDDMFRLSNLCSMTCLDCQICAWNRWTGRVWNEFKGNIWPCKHIFKLKRKCFQLHIRKVFGLTCMAKLKYNWLNYCLHMGSMLWEDFK